jgi:hypothetical protein
MKAILLVTGILAVSLLATPEKAYSQYSQVRGACQAQCGIIKSRNARGNSASAKACYDRCMAGKKPAKGKKRVVPPPR